MLSKLYPITVNIEIEIDFEAEFTQDNYRH